MISPETPFGIYLYPVFEFFYYLITGDKARKFHFRSGRTPLSTNQEGKTMKNTLTKKKLKLTAISDRYMHYLFHCYFRWSVYNEKQISIQA
jgi:hypothetical protein